MTGFWIRFCCLELIAICAHLFVSNQRKRQLQLPTGSSNWVEGTPLMSSATTRPHDVSPFLDFCDTFQKRVADGDMFPNLSSSGI